MSVYGGPASWWTINKDVGRTHIATKGTVQSGLVINYDAGSSTSYPGSGTTWSNLTAAANNATLSGATFNSAGYFSLNGSSNYIQLPAINTNAEFTLEFWMSHSSDTTPTLLAGAATNYLQIRAYVASVSLVNSYVAELGNFGASSGVPLNTITQVVLTRLGTTFSAYTNGTFRNTLTVTASFTTTSPTIGINNGVEYLTGSIYRFSYYNRQLTAAEISQNFNAVRTRYGI